MISCWLFCIQNYQVPYTYGAHLEVVLNLKKEQPVSVH